jgi:hypothetical protein
VWGVNDLDEASPLPYTSDLVRLATSAVLAAREGRLATSVRRICRSILDGYATSLAKGGRPIVLAERNSWLRQIAINALKDPEKFWLKLEKENAGAAAVPASLMRLLALPQGSADVRLFPRRAGVGSLGRPRLVALASHDGGLIAREAKALVPPASAWVGNTRRPRSFGLELSQAAVRAQDPYFNADTLWSVRRLSPDCLKIEITNLPRGRDDDRLLRAMGWETANIHLGTPRLRVAKDLAGRSGRWLERATGDMIDALVADQRAWKKHQRRSRRPGAAAR